VRPGGGQGKPHPDSLPPAGGWPDRAACAGDTRFDQLPVRDAKRVCRTCSVIDDCLLWVLALPSGTDPGHVAGGTTESERMGLRRKNSMTVRPQYPPGWSRVCPGCEQDLPADAYGVDRLRLEGLRRYCRVCTGKRARAYKQGTSQEAM